MKKLIIPAVVLLILVIGAFFFFKGKTREIIITQAQLEQKLSEKFPYTKKFLLLFELTYSNPKLSLLEGSDKIRVGLDAAINLLIDKEGKDLNGGITVLAELRYDRENQAFHLDNAELERLDIDGIPEKWEERVMKLSTEAANLYFKNHPVYELEHRNFKESVAKILLKNFEIRDEIVVVTVGL